MSTRYADQRLAALWDRVEQLEAAVEIAGAHLERDRDLGSLAMGGRAALLALKAALHESFRSALLCNRDTSDGSLDTWLEAAESHEVAQAADGGEAQS